MRSAAALLSCLLACSAALPLRAQALNVDAEEFRRMAGELADLRDASLAQQKRISALQREIEQLRDAVRDSQDRTVSKLGDFATREDLRKLVDQIKEVDSRRESDRKLILNEFESLGKTLSQAAARPVRRRDDTESRPDPKPAEPVKPIEGTFLEYTIQPNESLSVILQHYNAELQKQGRPSVSMKQVVQANPRMNPDRIFAGQKIQLPVPDKKN
jgi:LysM repeat protein